MQKWFLTSSKGQLMTLIWLIKSDKIATFWGDNAPAISEKSNDVRRGEDNVFVKLKKSNLILSVSDARHIMCIMLYKIHAMALIWNITILVIYSLKCQQSRDLVISVCRPASSVKYPIFLQIVYVPLSQQNVLHFWKC